MHLGVKPALPVALLAAAALLATASAVRAATVVQTHSFDIANNFATHPVPMSGVAGVSADATDLTVESFAPFDTGLGALTGVHLSVLATEDFRGGASIFVAPGQNAAKLTMVAGAQSLVQFLGMDLDPFSDTTPTQICLAYDGSPCLTLASFHRHEVFDTSFADLGAFLLGPTLDLTLKSIANASGGVLSGGGPYPTFTLAGELDWVGAATLTYTYEPFVISPGVPEPADWTLLLVGFAGLGVALRSTSAAARRRCQAGAA